MLSIKSMHAWVGMSSHFASTRFHRDRKSTRLNSSHSQISYAVFCLQTKLGSLGCQQCACADHTSDGISQCSAACQPPMHERRFLPVDFYHAIGAEIS